MSEPFIAEIRMFPYTFAPRDWAYCDGQLLNISQNAALYSLISNVYGGDGRTTMGLPNLKGRSPMNWGQSPGLLPYQIGQTVGQATVDLQTSQIPSHTHTVSADAAQGTIATPVNNYISQGVKPGSRGKIIDANNFSTDISNTAQMAVDAVGASGGGQAHYNRQLFLAVPFCIALQGLFPSRN